MTPRRTVEWQVCGVCNYDCSYCVQKKASRTGRPGDGELDDFLRFFETLPGAWEVKMTGGEPFALPAFVDTVVAGLVARTPHLVSVLTNLSAPLPRLLRFAELTRGRLGIVSASLHLEFVAADAFVEKALRLREALDSSARLVVNQVLVPGRLHEVACTKEKVVAAGLSWFPQLLKTKHGVHEYDENDRALVVELAGRAPTPREANVAPSYRGRACRTGADYFVLTQQGEGWSCRTARRFGEGRLGNVHDGSFRLLAGARPCPWDICPCTVPANRGMIEGVGAAAEDA